MTGNPEDDEYTRATKAVVDDTMRIDVLGPNVCKVLKEHSPTSTQIKQIMIDAIKTDKNIQDALAKVSEDQATTNKGRGLNQIQAIALTALITAIVTGIVAALFIQFGMPPH